MKKYTTERGVKIGIRPIPLLLDEIRKTNPPPEQPSYTEHLAGDATQERTITEAMAEVWARENPDSWEEHAEAWAEYEAERDAWDEVLSDRILDAVAFEAVDVPMPADGAWIRRHKLIYGMDVPDDPDLQRIHYVKTEVLGGPRDILQVTVVAGGADLDEEALAIAEESFRHTLQGSLTEGLAAQAGSVADVDAEDRATDGEGVG